MIKKIKDIVFIILQQFERFNYKKGITTLLIICIGIEVSGCDFENIDWKKAKETNTVESYHAFLIKHPKSKFISETNGRIELLLWERAKGRGDLESYEAYLLQYPNGQFSDEIKGKMNSVSYNVIINKLETQFIEKLSKSNTVIQINALIGTYKKYPFIDKAVEKIEKILVEQIIATGAKGKFVLREIMPQKGVPKCSLTFSALFASKGIILDLVSYQTEFPNDTIVRSMPFVSGGYLLGSGNGIIRAAQLFDPNTVSDSNCLGEGSIHRFDGLVKLDIKEYSYIFGEGDKLNRFTFALLKDIGYVYLRGKGQLIKEDSKVIKFGY